MTLWSLIVSKLKEMMKSMIGSRTIEQTLHVAPAISSQMEQAITLWSDMYKNQAPWIKEPSFADPTRIVSMGLPSLIASEKSRIALLEFQSEITAPTEEVEKENPNYKEPEPDEFGNMIPTAEPKTIKEQKPVGPIEKAEYLNSQYEKLKKQLRKQIEYGIAKGGLVVKPYVVQKKIAKVTMGEGDKKPKEDKSAKEQVKYDLEFDFIQADCFYPLAFDASGSITEAAFLDTFTEKDTVYRRLEYHKWQNNTVEIINKAFKSTVNQGTNDMNGVDLGHEVMLTDVPQWKDLKEKVTIKNVAKPLFAYFKMPEANIIDTSSPLGMSGFARAVQHIKDADMQYSRLLWEYEAGEMAIDIDRDAMNFMEDGSGTEHTVMNHLQNRLFRKVDLGESDTYQPYNPTLRDTSYIQGLNTILMRIEDDLGLSRGTISDAAAEARTATELKILKQRSYQTNADIQKAIQDMLEDAIYVMSVYCDLYEIAKGDYEVSYEWDDSIITDVDAELGKRMTLMQNGITSKIETRMWYFGETEQQAREALQKIKDESLSDAEDEMALNSNFGDNSFGGFNKNKEKKETKPEESKKES